MDRDLFVYQVNEESSRHPSWRHVKVANPQNGASRRAPICAPRRTPALHGHGRHRKSSSSTTPGICLSCEQRVAAAVRSALHPYNVRSLRAPGTLLRRPGTDILIPASTNRQRPADDKLLKPTEHPLYRGHFVHRAAVTPPRCTVTPAEPASSL